MILAIAVAIGIAALGLAEAHAHRDGHPRRCRRPRDGLGARDQHPAHVRDRVRRRFGARRSRRRDRRLVREPRAGRRRELVAVFARRRDHRRHGLARRCGDRLAAARPDDATSQPRTCRRTTPTTRSSSRSCSSRSCSPSARSASSGGPREQSGLSRPCRRVGALVLAVLAPFYVSGYWVGTLLTQMLIPRHRRGEPDLPLGVRGHGVARPGRGLRHRRVRRRQRDDEREHQGPEPRLEPVVGNRARNRHHRRRRRCCSARSQAAASGSTS